MNERPKVGIYARPIDLGGGSGSHLSQLVERMVGFDNRFDIHLIHHTRNGNEIYGRAHEILVPRNPLRAAWALRNEGLALLHFAPPTIFTPAWMPRVKRVATIHSMEALQIPQHYGIRRKVHDRYVLRAWARKMDAVFTVSQASREFLVSEFGLEPERVRLTYNAVSPDFRRLTGQERELAQENVLSRHGVSPPFLFHVSLYRARKNPWTLLEAFAILCRDRAIPKALKLVIAGGGWNSPKVDELVQQLGIEGKVVRPGFLPRKDLVEFLNLASAFVFPTLFEGSGMSNLEAMACHCPVITTRSGAVPEIVGDAALVADHPADATEFARHVANVLSDANLRRSLIDKGIKRAQRYSWQESARTVLDTYAELCSV